jgi:hypothetical protein
MNDDNDETRHIFICGFVEMAVLIMGIIIILWLVP